MTKEQVIAMAQICGDWNGETVEMNDVGIKHFAALVRNAAVIEERMALADLCDAMGSPQIAEYLRTQAEIIRNLKEPT